VKVVLTDGRQTQVLYSADGFVDDPHFYIEWAGDLDGDGKLDLVVNLSRKYSVHPHRLLLSSKASPTELVREVAAFLTHGSRANRHDAGNILGEDSNLRA
jgi:hypothetical protein